MTVIDLEHLKQWEGKQEIHEDVISLATAQALAATLDWQNMPEAGDVLANAGHWMHFLPNARQSDIGHDGHPKKGGFLPPVPLPRRMWASGSLDFQAPLRIGEVLKKVSTINSIKHKQGGTGSLVFVEVGHEIYCGETLAIVDTQNLVYREEPDPSAAPRKPVPPPAPAEFSRTIIPDPVLLFRFSALTFNSHRIHYDRNYAVQEEGYTGLVVHAPLSATLILDLAREYLPEANIEHFEYRAVQPLLDAKPFHVQGCAVDGGLNLWVVDGDGGVTMQASLTLK